MLVSVHIPKCGGISFQHVLKRVFGKRKVWLNYGIFFSKDQARYDLMPRGTRCVHGHFLSDTFDDFVPQPDLVTWFRHPVERVISNYHHFHRHREPSNPCCRALFEQQLSLEAFAELEPMRNEATRYLAGKPLSAFKFVGIMERYAESLAIFGSIFRVQVPFTPPRENVNPFREAQAYSVSSQTYEHIRSLNLRDVMLYEAAAASLDGRVRRVSGK